MAKLYDITFRGVNANALAHIIAGARHERGGMVAEPEIMERDQAGAPRGFIVIGVPRYAGSAGGLEAALRKAFDDIAEPAKEG